MNPVQQLTDCNHADRAVLLAKNPLDLRTADTVPHVDQQVRVDQDGHDGSGGATSSRSSRSSVAKRSSGGGAVAISSRKRSGDISRALGGAITATGAPARVTSISSPAATRLRTSENPRAASVAVIRVTSPVSIR